MLASLHPRLFAEQSSTYLRTNLFGQLKKAEYTKHDSVDSGRQSGCYLNGSCRETRSGSDSTALEILRFQTELSLGEVLFRFCG